MNANVPAGAAMLLDFIGRAETGKTGREAYDVIVFYKQDKLPKPLTEYTISELLEAQKTWAKNWRGSAAGKYQIIRKTLQGLVDQMGIPGNAKFTPDLQDRLAYRLLTTRGWQAFTSGQVTLNAFALQLAKEWASMPVLSTVQGAHRVVKRGESYYAGDGVNASQKSADEFEAALKAALATKGSGPVILPTTPNPPPPDVPVIEPDPAKPKKGSVPLGVILAALIALVAAGVALFVPLPI